MSAEQSGPSIEVIVGAGVGGLVATAVAWVQAMPPQAAAALALLLLAAGGWASTRIVRR